MWSLGQIVDVLSVLSHSLPDRTAALWFRTRLAALIHSSFQMLTKVTNPATRWLLDRPASFKRSVRTAVGQPQLLLSATRPPKNTPVRRPSDRLVHNVIVIINFIEYIATI